MESIEKSNSFKCKTRGDFKKVAKALVETEKLTLLFLVFFLIVYFLMIFFSSILLVIIL